MRRCRGAAVVLAVCALAASALPAAATHDDPFIHRDEARIAYVTALVKHHHNPWYCKNKDGCDWDPRPSPGDDNDYTAYSVTASNPQPGAPLHWNAKLEKRSEVTGLPENTVVVTKCRERDRWKADCGHDDAGNQTADWGYGDRTTPPVTPKRQRDRTFEMRTPETENDVFLTMAEIHRGSDFTEVFAVCLTDEQIADGIRDHGIEFVPFGQSGRAVAGGWTEKDAFGERWEDWHGHDDDESRLAVYDEWMGDTFDITRHGTPVAPKGFWWRGEKANHPGNETEQAEDTDCVVLSCDADGDGEPDPPPALPGPDDPWPGIDAVRPPFSCVCRNALEINIRKYLQDGTRNWLGWQGLAWFGDPSNMMRARDRHDDGAWAEDADGNPICGWAH